MNGSRVWWISAAWATIDWLSVTNVTGNDSPAGEGNGKGPDGRYFGQKVDQDQQSASLSFAPPASLSCLPPPWGVQQEPCRPTAAHLPPLRAPDGFAGHNHTQVPQPHPYVSQRATRAWAASTNHPALQLILKLQAWLIKRNNVGHYYAHIGLGLVQCVKHPVPHWSLLLQKGALRWASGCGGAGVKGWGWDLNESELELFKDL